MTTSGTSDSEPVLSLLLDVAIGRGLSEIGMLRTVCALYHKLYKMARSVEFGVCMLLVRN